MTGAHVLGWLVGCVARVWLATLRVTVLRHPELSDTEEPWVLCFWHGAQWPLLAWPRRRRTTVLVSHSRDGAIQSRALTMLGLRVVRGSSSRGGARGLAALVRSLRTGADVAFAVDGPKGPAKVAKPGAIAAALHARAKIIPMGSAIARGLVLKKAWDHFAIAWPFTRVTVVLGSPIDPAAPDARELLELSIARCQDVAESALQSPAKHLWLPPRTEDAV